MNLRTPLILLLFTFNITLYSQNIFFKTYTVNDGMVANAVRKVIQDSKGFLWIATWEGLSKYDGNKFSNYNTTNGLSFDLINDLYEDSLGRIYLAENNGGLDIIQEDHIIADRIHKNLVVNAFFSTAQKKVYAATDDKGLLEFNSREWDTSFTQKLNTIIDFAVLNDSLSLVINNNLKPFLVDKKLNLFSSLPNTNLIALSVSRDREGRVWLCTNEGLKLVASIQKRSKPMFFEKLPIDIDRPFVHKQNVYGFFEDRDGNCWISTLTGLGRIDNHGNLQIFTTRNGLPTNVVNHFYQDREENIWMCSEVGLIKIVMKNNLQYFGKQNGLKSDEVLSLIPSGSSIYLNNATHILRMDLENKISTVMAVSGRNFFTSFLLDEKGAPSALLTAKELYKIERPHSSLVTTGGTDYLFCLTADKYGNYFIGSDMGLIIKTRDGIIHCPELPFRITALEFDKQGNLWAGTWREGLYRFDMQSSANSVSYRVRHFSSLIPDKNIRSILVDRRGNTWIGTRYQGAYMLNAVGSYEYRVKNYTQKNGMNSNWVKAIGDDADGNIWIGTLQGLNKLIPVKDNFRIFDFSRINHSFGAVNCIYAGPDHQVWYGGPTGIVRFKDDEMDTTPAPSVYLTSIQSKNNKPFEAGISKEVSLPYTSNQLNFEYSAPSFINEKEIQYSYRLIGSADTSWSVPSNRHAVSYASLAPGDYHFQIRAIGWNGLPGNATSFSFIVEKPFWQTWWFYLLGSLVLILLVYVLYRYRIRQLIQVQKVRDRIATDLHDDIGSSLTNINILSELSFQNMNRPEHARQFLKRIAEEVGNTSQAMDDIIWNVNRNNDSVEETVNRMRRFAAELFDQSNIRYQLELDDTIHGKRMNMEQRRDVFLMYKEMLNNVYKHSEADTVIIAAKLNGNVLHLDVHDDGKAFDANAVTHRNGLKNLHQRTARWNGTIAITSQPEKGTAIHITLPLVN